MISKKWSLLVMLLIASILLAVYSVNLLLLGIGFYITYLLFSNAFSPVIFNSRFLKIVLSSLLYVAVAQSAVFIIWVFNHNASLHLVPLVATGLVGATFLLFKKLTKNNFGPHVQLPNLRATDYISLSIALIVTLLILFGPLKTAAKTQSVTSKATFLQYMDTSIDDSNHLSRINDRIQLDRGVIYGSDQVTNVVLAETISSYPPSWHSVNAVFLMAATPNINVGIDSAVGYVLTKFAWFFLLVFLFSRTILVLFEIYIRKLSRKDSAIIIWLGGSILYFSFYMLIEQFREGFYSFIPELIVVLGISLLLIQLSIDKTKSYAYRSFVPLILLIVSGALSWVLLLPAAVVAVVLSCINFTNRKTIESSIKNCIQQSLVYLPLVIAGIAAVLAQIYLLKAGTSRTFRAGINDPGSISIHSTWYFVFILVGLLLFYVAIKKSLREISFFITSLVGLAFFIFMFQIATIGKIEYYTLKTLNLAIIITLPIAVVGWALLLEKIHDKQTTGTKISLSLLFLLLLPMIIGINPTNSSTLGYIWGKRPLTTKDVNYIAQSFTDRSQTPIAERSNNIIFFYKNDFGRNVIGTNLSRTIQHVDGCNDRLFRAVLVNNEQVFLSSLQACSNAQQDITVVTGSDYIEQLETLAADMGIGSNVVFTAYQP